MSLDQKRCDDIIIPCLFLFPVFCCIWVKSPQILFINGHMLCSVDRFIRNN